MKKPEDQRHLRGPVLRAVSRSFYLSLRILPEPLRDPLSLAYLLARATDTIADTTQVPVTLRMEALRELAGAIQGPAPEELEFRNSFARQQSNEIERELIEQIPALLNWLAAVPTADREEVRDVLVKINRGQTLDLERFGESKAPRALPTAADLDEYTYLVAGCVGEFWTRICFAHVRNFSARAESEMLELGVQYGKGLQLINILRDAGSDLRAGRCYLPADQLHSLGLTPEEVLAKPLLTEPILREWCERAEHRMAAGIDYACAIRSRRVRFATALPALIGAHTLSLLREAGPEVFERTVKVPRREVKKMMASTAVRLASPRILRETFLRSVKC